MSGDGRRPKRSLEAEVRRLPGGGLRVQPVANAPAWELTDVAELIWRRSDGRHTVADIVEEIVERYEIDRDRAQADALAFIGELESERLLTWAGP